MGTFGLLSVQFAFTFVMMLILEFALPWERFGRRSTGTQTTFIFVGFLTAALLFALRVLMRKYPWNYLLLLLITLLVGVSWGLSCSVLTGQLHFHIVGIMTIAMPVATIISTVMSLHSVEPQKTVTSAIFLGWLAGSFVDLVVLVSLPEGSLSAVSIAILFTAALFAAVVYDSGDLLVQGNPDDFMRVIISMDSGLLVVISIPIFAICFGCHHVTNTAESEAREDALAEAQGRASRAERGMVEPPIILGPPQPVDP